jgi:hypothetical protein
VGHLPVANEAGTLRRGAAETNAINLDSRTASKDDLDAGL